MKNVKMYYAHVVGAYTGIIIKSISGTNKADVRETARDAATPTATACGGNCSDCVNGLAGCIAAKAGDIVALYEHSTINAAKLETVPGGHVYGRYDGGTWYGGIYTADGNDDYETTGRTLETLICNIASVGGYTADAIRENIVIE